MIALIILLVVLVLVVLYFIIGAVFARGAVFYEERDGDRLMVMVLWPVAVGYVLWSAWTHKATLTWKSPSGRKRVLK